jgi:hypothetical protein
MAINKFTSPTFDSVNQPDLNLIYGQRVGEAGLSQTMTIEFDGFTHEEKQAILDIVSHSLRARIDSMGSVG